MMRTANPEDFTAGIEGAAAWEVALLVVTAVVLLGALALTIRERGFRPVFLERDSE